MPAAEAALWAGLPTPAVGVFSTTQIASVHLAAHVHADPPTDPAAAPSPSGLQADLAGSLARTSAGPAGARAALAARRQLAAAVGVTTNDLVFAEQVHGRGVAVVTGPTVAGQVVAGVDALVTRTRGVGLVALAADCMPVLLADPVGGVVAAAHAGRSGLRAGVLAATVEVMLQQGAAAARVCAVVGPCIGGCCYELPATLVDAVDAELPGVAANTTWGTPSIDLRRGAQVALAAVGVRDVRHVGGCTFEQPELLFSHRRSGTPGRHGGVVVLS